MRAPKRILVAARILVGQTQDQVAAECGLAKKTVYRAELGTAGTKAVETLMEHYERSGIRFIQPTNGNGWGMTACFLTLPYERETQG